MAHTSVTIGIVQSVERRKQGRGSHGHFLGFWVRLKCENMPVIPAWVVRSNLNDPRRIPYLLVCKDDRHDGKIMEAVRLGHGGFSGLAELKRADESTTVLRTVWRMLPATEGERSSCIARTVTRRAVTSTDGRPLQFPLQCNETDENERPQLVERFGRGARI